MTDRIDLHGATALVTGAAKRLGGAVSLALAKAGVNIIAHYRTSQAEAEALAAAVRKTGARAWTLPGDLRHPHQAKDLFHRACEAAGPIDFLLNNASIFPESSLLDCTPEDIYANIDVNALSPLLLARAFAAQNRTGAIVNFLDTMIADYDRKHVPYHLSKRMLFSLTKMMAIEFAPKLRVNAVAPGLVLPPEGKDEQYLEALAHTNPLQRYGSAEGIAEAVLFLLRSGFITGQIIYVDGGRHLRGNMYG